MSDSLNAHLKEKEYLIRVVLNTKFSINHICKKYRIEKDDLKQIGLIALWEASKRFRPKKDGMHFETYAKRIINFRLLNYLAYLEKPIRQLDYSESIYTEILEGMELVETISCDENVEDQVLDKFYFETMTSDLSNREKSIFKQRLSGYTYVEIERKLRIKNNRFRKTRESMVEKLKRNQEQLVI